LRRSWLPWVPSIINPISVNSVPAVRGGRAISSRHVRRRVTEAAAEAELLVCDSSFVGAIAQRRTQPERVAHWDTRVLDRIDRARNAISVVTLA
jgi:hypothetical protein